MKRDVYLIVKLGALGDVMVATALTRALRAAAPLSRIVMLTSPECRPLLENNPDLDQVVTHSFERGLGGFGAMCGELRRLAAGRQGTALILHRHPLLAGACRLGGFHRVIGFSERWNPVLTRSVAFDLRRHRLGRQEEMLRVAGFPVQARQMRLELTAAEREWGEAVWRPSESGSRRLVLAPGGGRNRWAQMPNRRWPAQSFRRLAGWARDAGMQVRIIGGPEDRALAEEIACDLDGVRADGAGCWSIRETAAVIAAAQVVVSNDSLPMFLAAALGTRVVGLYGPTDHRLIHPPGAGAAIQGIAGCGPCYVPTDGVRGMAYRCPRARCMESLDTDQVWPAVLAEMEAEWARRRLV